MRSKRDYRQKAIKDRDDHVCYEVQLFLFACQYYNHVSYMLIFIMQIDSHFVNMILKKLLSKLTEAENTDNLFRSLSHMYISKSALVELKTELEERTKTTRREIADLISSAKEQGDLSENFEYQDAKEQQALNEARIAQLEGMIHNAVIVEETSGGVIVQLGCTFRASVNGIEKTYSMVGSHEAEPMAGKISNESPLGRALIGHSSGECVSVQTPNGEIEYKIIEIK